MPSLVLSPGRWNSANSMPRSRGPRAEARRRRPRSAPRPPARRSSRASSITTRRVWHSRAVFDHVTIRVSNRKASERFYETVLSTIGIDETYSGEQFTEWGDFSLAEASAWNPVTHGLHVGFGASSRERVDEFWRAGRAAGYRDDGEPGPRPEYGDDYYGGFLLDPDRNSEVADRLEAEARGVDHLFVCLGYVADS